MSTKSFLKNPPGLRQRVIISAGLGRFEGDAPTNSQYSDCNDFGMQSMSLRLERERSGPLNDSQTRQPKPHMSAELEIGKQKRIIFSMF